MKEQYASSKGIIRLFDTTGANSKSLALSPEVTVLETIKLGIKKFRIPNADNPNGT